jgi:hypothetical protein
MAMSRARDALGSGAPPLGTSTVRLRSIPQECQMLGLAASIVRISLAGSNQGTTGSNDCAGIPQERQMIGLGTSVVRISNQGTTRSKACAGIPKTAVK